jgi:hypothetical protein
LGIAAFFETACDFSARFTWCEATWECPKSPAAALAFHAPSIQTTAARHATDHSAPLLRGVAAGMRSFAIETVESMMTSETDH